MAQLSSYDPEVMVFKNGGGCLSIFGLPFLLVGIFTMATLFTGFGLQGEPTPWYFIVLFGGAFTLLGMSMVFGRSGFSIDKRMGTVKKWWSVIITLKSTSHRLEKYDQVHLTKEIRRGKNSTYIVYPVKLVGKNGEVAIEESQKYEKQRRIAESIAKFTGFSMLDSSSGNEVIRTPDLLDETIRERVRRTGEISEVPPAPAVTKMDYNVAEREIRVSIPPHALTRLILTVFGIVGLVLLVFFAFFASEALSISDIPWFVKIIFFAIFGIPAIIVFLILLYMATKKTLLKVSPDTLSLTEIWTFGKKTREIPTSELEELQITTQFQNVADLEKLSAFFFRDVIIARSDKLTLEFGRGLNREEMCWLHSVIENMVSM